MYNYASQLLDMLAEQIKANVLNSNEHIAFQMIK